MEQTFHYTIFAYSIFFKGNYQISALCCLFCTGNRTIPDSEQG